MVVMLLERVTPGVRGELTRWLLEVRAGVFVGTVGARVRDRLWQHVIQKLGVGSGMLIYTGSSEQGFTVELSGSRGRSIADFDGLLLIRRLASERH